MNLKEKLDYIEKTCSEQGWDGYDADPVSNKVLETARKLIPLFNEDVEAFPISDGTIQFERDKDGLYTELSIVDENSISLFVQEESKISISNSKVRMGEDNRIYFMCPACGIYHWVTTPTWTFNGNMSSPTIDPSIFVRIPSDKPYNNRICHSFIKDGHITYGADCNHELRGRTVNLPEIRR